MAMRKRSLVLALALLLLLAGGAAVMVATSNHATQSDVDDAKSPPRASTRRPTGPGARVGPRTRPQDVEVPEGSEPKKTADPADASSEGRVVEPDAPKSPRSPSTTSASAPPEKLEGRIVDAATNEPIEGARVIYAVLVHDKLGSWQGDTTRAAGDFRNKRPSGWDAKGARTELRVAKDGYETAFIPVAGDIPVVTLRRRDQPLMPGRVLGVARDGSGMPLSGVLLVDGRDEIGGNAAQYVVADAGGSFVLEGIPAGPWRFWLSSSPDDRTEVGVPAGGEARMELKVGSDSRTDEERVNGPWLEGYGDPPKIDPVDGRRPAPREVVVSGLPSTVGTIARVSLEGHSPRLFWRVEAKGGTARFPSLPVGSWTLHVLEPGKPTITMPLMVAPGDGPISVPFAAR